MSVGLKLGSVKSSRCQKEIKFAYRDRYHSLVYVVNKFYWVFQQTIDYINYQPAFKYVSQSPFEVEAQLIVI